MLQLIHAEIALVTDPGEIKRLYAFIKAQPLDYPNYDAWVEKCLQELQAGVKHALVARTNELILANVIFQTHKQEPRILEVKNCRVDISYRGKGIFTKLMVAVEEYAREKGYQRIIVDAHTSNIPFIKAAERTGFRKDGEEPLYNEKLETILVKDIK